MTIVAVIKFVAGILGFVYAGFWFASMRVKRWWPRVVGLTCAVGAFIGYVVAGFMGGGWIFAGIWSVILPISVVTTVLFARTRRLEAETAAIRARLGLRS